MNEWSLEVAPVFAVCMAEGSSIFIDAGSEIKDTLNVVLPSGNIGASISLIIGNNWENRERISTLFEYQK